MRVSSLMPSSLKALLSKVAANRPGLTSLESGVTVEQGKAQRAEQRKVKRYEERKRQSAELRRLRRAEAAEAKRTERAHARAERRAVAVEAKRRERVNAKAERQAQRQRLLDARPLVTELPFEIDNIELTNRCPMRCIMCPRTKHMTRSQGYMPFEVFTRVIDELVAVNPNKARTAGVWLHHFGESMMHPEFARFIKYANEASVATRISVNPLMLKERLARQLLEASPTHVMFSLDGHDDESFHRIRGVKNAYGLSKERLLTFLASKVRSDCTSKMSLSMIDFAENRESIDAMKDFWAGVEGLDEVQIKAFTTWDGSAPEINEFSTDSVDNQEARTRFSMPTCNLPWRKVTVMWDGDVVPCCYDFDKKVVLGNLAEQSLSEIWNGPRMQELRREFLSNDVRNPLCRGCGKLYE